LLKDIKLRGRRGRDRMVVGFITTYAIRAYYHFMNSNPTQARCTRYNIMAMYSHLILTRRVLTLQLKGVRVMVFNNIPVIL
jgi:hypothetical protein